MKRLMILAGVWMGISVLAHATGTQNSVDQKLGTTKDSTAVTDPNSNKMESGSGDDAETINEADPSHDKDPEASDDTENGPNPK